ncbi:3-isopropylmalate dehydratase small subunit [Paraburkholderia caribensis]|uniref:3-isopropylmalate dehydratase small subunit n=1 Tax=Paraburkholderia caribensis TaxID=75105 RepID=UPI0031DF3A23
MKPFTLHTGLVALLDRDNVDTDAIMPKQFMKSISRTGFGPYVFDEWRFTDPGYFGKRAEERVPRPEFPLNQSRYRGASVLLTGANFGCGSSREHAPWALQQAGFAVLIAKSFADIFENNCKKIGLLPIALDCRAVDQLMAVVEASHGYKIEVDLAEQTVGDESGFEATFEIDPAQKDRLLNGTDEIGATLRNRADIARFEEQHFLARPWLRALETLQR